MQRRNFLKGALLVAASPLVPDIKPVLKLVEAIREKKAVDYFTERQLEEFDRTLREIEYAAM